MIKRYAKRTILGTEGWELYVLRNRMDQLVDHVRKMNSQLRVAREDIILLEEGISQDIDKITNDIALLKGANL